MTRVSLVALLLLASCAMPTDPCPTPPEQHTEAWQPLKGVDGQVFGYVCAAQ